MKKTLLFFMLVIVCNIGFAQYFRDQFLGQYIAQNKRVTRLGLYFETTWHVDTFNVELSPSDSNKIIISNVTTGLFSNNSFTEEFLLYLDSTFRDDPNIDSGFFYFPDSIYLMITDNYDMMSYWDYYWGKRITTTSYINNSSIMIDLFPNPASDIIYINTSKTYIPIRIGIYDLFGKLYKEAITNKTNENIDISDLPKGMYIVKVKSNSEVFCKKILKE